MLVDDQHRNQAGSEKPPTKPHSFTGSRVRERALLLWQRRAEIFLVALIFASAAVAIGERLTPRYSATAQLYIDPRELQPVDHQPAPRSQDVSNLAMVVESQLRIVGSNGVLLQAIADTDLVKDPEFGSSNIGDDAEMAALETLKHHIKVTKSDDSFVINIEVWSDAAAKSALLANAIANAYLGELKKSQDLAARRAAAYLSDRLKVLQQQISIAETALTAYQAQQHPLDAEGALTGDPRLDASRRLAAARAATLDAQARYDRIQGIQRDAIDVDAIPRVLQSPILANLRVQYDATRRRYAELASEIGPRHPALRQIVGHLEDLHRGISEEIERSVLSAKNELNRARENEDSLNKAIESQKRESAELDQPSPKLRELEGNVEASRNLYQSFLQRWRENDERRGLNALSARVISAAIAPQWRLFPPAMSLFASIGFGLGAFAAAAWLVAANRLPPKTSDAASEKTRDQTGAKKSDKTSAKKNDKKSDKTSEPQPDDPGPVQTVASPPPAVASPPQTVASPPIQPPDHQPQPDIVVASIEKPLIARLQEAEVVRTQSSVLTAGALTDLTRIGWPTLRTGLPGRMFIKSIGEMRAAAMRRPSAGAIPVMAVIGAGASEDRSIASLNVALAAARDGCRVLLIDADLATPTLSKRLHGPGKRAPRRFGWFGIGLKEAATIETANGISVLPVNGGSAIKAGEAVGKAIAEARSLGGYDLVILDGPATPSSDADRKLLDVADGLIADLPMRLDINDCVRDIIAALGDIEPKLIGFVLNELHPAAAGTGADKQLA